MLHISNLTKYYGDNLVFERVNLIINAGDRVGLVGPNGCGKTTLLRILAGQEQPDSGSVRLTAPNVRIGYLPQALVFASHLTVHEALYSEWDPEALSLRVAQLAEQLAHAAGERLPELERAYAEALERLSWSALHLPEHRARSVLSGLALEQIEPTLPVRKLSGGQKTRLGLARLLLQNPSLLLLDEPTNHLDIAGLEWLEDYLHAYDGAMLIVSHDRVFLDRTISRVAELDPQTHTLQIYEGRYQDYALAKAHEREKHWQAYKEQEGRIERLESAMRQLKGQARKIEGETIHFYYRKIAKKVARQGVVRQKRIERMLNSEEHLDKPKQSWQMKLEFVHTPTSGEDVLILEGVSKRFGALALFDDVHLTLSRGERIALVGPNGSGKTTLLRLIAGQEPPTCGQVRLGANVQIGYFSQEQDSLDWTLTPLEIVRKTAALSETDARSFLHYFLFAGDDVFAPLGNISYGERARLALAVLVLGGCNLLLLDEPINHLDIPSREKFEQALSRYEGSIIAVVHDRYFIERYATRIWAIEGGAIHAYPDLRHLRRYVNPTAQPQELAPFE